MVVGGDQIKRGKPDPETFLKVAEALGQKPEDCLVFEDAHSGVHAAVAAGMSVVLVPDLLPATPEIAAKTAGVFPSLHHVVTWIDALPAGRS